MRVVERSLHDIAIRIEAFEDRAARILADYVSYLDDPWPVEPQHAFRFRFAVASYLDVAALVSRESTGPVRSAAGFDLWREGDLAFLRMEEYAFGQCDLAASSAHIALAPEASHNPLVIRNLVGIFLTEMLRRAGRYPLHAAGAADDGRGVVVIGPAGAGKSTLTLGMARAGFAIASDDWLLLEETPSGIDAIALIRVLSIPVDQLPDPSSLEIIATHADDWTEKYIVDRSALTDRIAHRIRPAVLVCAERVDDALSEVQPVTESYAVARALAQSALIPGDQATIRKQMAAVGRLARQCVCVALRAGRDAALDPTVGADLIRQVLAGETP